MLPLLPALLLLLLQGPATIERMAWDSRLPAVLVALQREAPRCEASEADEVLLASLLAVSKDRQLVQALWHLLAAAEPDTAQREADAVESVPSGSIPAPPHLGTPGEGYGSSERTRDGPL